MKWSVKCEGSPVWTDGGPAVRSDEAVLLWRMEWESTLGLHTCYVSLCETWHTFIWTNLLNLFLFNIQVDCILVLKVG